MYLCMVFLQIYISGGMEKNQTTNRVQCFDHKHNVWIEKPALHTGKKRSLLEFEPTFYLFEGNFSLIRHSQLLLEDVEEFCKCAPTLFSARACHTMSCLGNQLIVCGGAGRVPIDGPSAPRHLSSVESYCLETEQWTYLSPMRFEACSPTAVGKFTETCQYYRHDAIKDILPRYGWRIEI